MVVQKVCWHHDGEREVYRVYDAQSGKEIALTVFNLKCERYEVDGISRNR